LAFFLQSGVQVNIADLIADTGLVARIVLGILLVVYPTVTINFFRAYWIVAAAVVGLAAIVIFLRRRKGRRRKGYLS